MLQSVLWKHSGSSRLFICAHPSSRFSWHASTSVSGPYCNCWCLQDPRMMQSSLLITASWTIGTVLQQRSLNLPPSPHMSMPEAGLCSSLLSGHAAGLLTSLSAECAALPPCCSVPHTSSSELQVACPPSLPAPPCCCKHSAAVCCGLGWNSRKSHAPGLSSGEANCMLCCPLLPATGPATY